jgi:DNA-binding SARP family transcriptional activator
LELFQLQGNLNGQVLTLISLAGILIDVGLLGEAGSLLTRSLQIGESFGSLHHLNLLRDTQSSRRLWLSGQFDQAEQILANQEKALQHQIISPLFLVEFLRMRGVVYCDQGRFVEAQVYLNIALTVAIGQDAWTLAPEVLTNLAWLYARQGKLALAWDLAKQVQALIVEGNIREYTQVRTLLGTIARQQGQHQTALFYLESAQKTFEAIDFKLGLWSCQLQLAQTYLDLGYERRAAASLRQIFPFAAQNSIGGAYFWDPVITAQLSVFALSNEIETLFAVSLATRLSQCLTINDVELLNIPEQPQICLSYICLLKAIGTDEAYDRLHSLSIANGVSQQIRDQAQKALPYLWNASMQPQRSEIRIFCLGPLQVERNGEPIKDADWAGKSKAGRQKVKALLAYLIEQGTLGATKDELVEAIWGETAWGRDETKLESSLARTLSALRQVLEPDLISPAPSSYIITEDGRYYLNLDRCWIDVVEFQHLMKQARDAKLSGSNAVAQEAYKKALSLYEGEYLRDVPKAEEWAGLQRFALSQQLGIALTALGNYHLEQGQTQEALTYFQDAIKEEPTNEIAHFKYIDALRREGRIEEAMSAYERCRKIYDQEVDEVPPETITQLYKNITLDIKESSLISALPK